MVERGEVNAVSPGYKVEQWEIRDAGGRVVDPEKEYGKWSDDDLTFIATKFELLEVSLALVPQDADAVIGADRAFPAPPADPHRDLRGRMEARTRMLLRANGLPSKGIMAGHALSNWRGQTIFDQEHRGRGDIDGRLLFYGGGFRQVELPPDEIFTDPPSGR